ncbi:adenylate cyclase CyaB-like isoform X2 [Pempheris klunzingeri]|uniref:adenylate cyclase CyaB-like isoform X2 n=1 Tax=Pempheris klunzingeri TaxID=3127111 RepID=UPI00397EA479
MRTAAVSWRLCRLPALLCGQFGAHPPPPLRAFSCSQTTAAVWECFAVKSSADTQQQTNCSGHPQNRVMPSNVEIKAKVSDATRFAERAAQLSQSEGTIIRQCDTFFNCSRGRLKLRDFMNESGQLIFYERPDTDGPKLSRYSISATSDPPGLRAVLSDALGVKGEVRKERRLFMIGQTRVHLDAVEGLGDYMELEVVMRPDQTVEEGQQVAEDLMEKLGVSKESLVTGAYMDLILKGHKEA